MNDDLKKLKVGDTVIISPHYRDAYLGIVFAVHKKYLVIQVGKNEAGQPILQNYSFDGCQRPRDKWINNFLYYPTEERIEKYREEEKQREYHALAKKVNNAIYPGNVEISDAIAVKLREIIDLLKREEADHD